MDELIHGVPNEENIFIGGDLNGHVGKYHRVLKEFMEVTCME